MSALQDENSLPVSKVQRVRLAADLLGISERTVYRRLRSGKLEELPAENRPVDSVMTNVSGQNMGEQIRSHIEPLIARMSCQNDMTKDNLTILRQELANWDAQIRALLENQQELTHTIQKMQAQIYELARLALQPPAKVEEKPLEVPVVVKPPAAHRRGGLAGWLRTLWGGDNHR